MHHYSILAVLTFSIISTIVWTLRKTVLKKRQLFPFIILETLVVFISVIAGSYIYLGQEKFMNMHKLVGVNELVYIVILGILITGSIFCMRYLIKNEDISKLSPMIGATNTIMVVLVGLFLFNEKITSRKLLSITLIISGLLLFLKH